MKQKKRKERKKMRKKDDNLQKSFYEGKNQANKKKVI